MIDILLNIADAAPLDAAPLDAEIKATLLHYGKVIGANIVQESANAEFILRHVDAFLEVCNSTGDVLRRFALPLALWELGEYLLGLLNGVAKNTAPRLLPLNGAFTLDVQNRNILVSDAVACELTEKAYNLTEKECAMLEYIVLASKEGGSKGADKDDLLQHVWGYNAQAKSRTIEVHLYRLRQKLLELGENAPNINVIDGKCYLN